MSPAAERPSKIAFLFPGQGRRPSAWAASSYDELPAARALFDRAGEVLGFDLQALCFEGPAEALEATDVSQPAIFVASLAALEGLKASDPDVVDACAGAAGLSLGEYTALVFAGALDFETGLKIVRRRGQAMQAAAVATPSGMTERRRASTSPRSTSSAAGSRRSADSGRPTCSGLATSSSRASSGAGAPGADRDRAGRRRA